jgi:ribosomal protein S18 acetylase RimI-like enzyme
MAAVHAAAFPKSALSQLGKPVVTRYYQWQLTGPHQVSAVGAWDQHQLLGFYVGGTFRGALEGFLRMNRSVLALAVLRRPWLIVTNSLFRERLLLASKILTKKLRRKRTPTKPKTTIQRDLAFGILAIAVDPAFQGRGVGQGLMTDAEQTARERKFPKMTLTVDVDNHQAIRFYERIGWSQISENGVWHGHMEKLLSNPE